MTAKNVRIGCAAGFWGDTETAAAPLLSGGDLDYLVFDYLAEITMSIMVGSRMRRPDGGHAHDFVHRVMRACLPEVMARGVKVVTNAGGIHPRASRKALEELASSQGLSPRIAVVTGDDLMPQESALREVDVREMFTGAPLPARMLSMNAYLGARPIVAALAAGADIVITGRVADSALVLGPLVHEQGIAWDDYDRLAQASLAGHIVECGAQATGGMLTDWTQIDDYADVGFPIVDCAPDGSFVVEKPRGTGGRVLRAGVLEQLLYEIGDPRAYLLPDVVCDFSEVQAEQVGDDRVHVRGAVGRPPPAQYKVSATYADGFKAAGALLIMGEQAVQKAEAMGDALRRKIERLLIERGFDAFREVRIDVLGAEAGYGAHGRASAAREVVLRMAFSHVSGDALKLALRELPQMGTGGAPSVCGGVAGRSEPVPMIRLFSLLVDRERVRAAVDFEGREIAFDDPAPERTFDPSALESNEADYPAVEGELRLPLLRLATGRSGDKGDHSNIGILAREPAYVPYIGAALTEQAVARHMAHVLDHPRSKVTRWELPGCGAFNFLLEHSLGGGGIASLRADPQGKSFAQQLLSFEVPVSKELYARLTNGESP